MNESFKSLMMSDKIVWQETKVKIDLLLFRRTMILYDCSKRTKRLLVKFPSAVNGQLNLFASSVFKSNGDSTRNILMTFSSIKLSLIMK